MKRSRLIWLIAAAMMALLVLAACGKTANNSAPTVTVPEPTYSVSAYKSQGTYVEVQNQLSWEELNKIPIKTSTMTPREARELCITFFRYAKTACWIPDTTLEFVRNSKGSADAMTKGQVYGGLPYVGLGSGNMYRLMDYMDPKTGVVDITNAVDKEKPYDGWKLLGNQCSIGAYWGWGRVINSAKYTWTQTMVEKNGFFRVGDYEYDLNLTRVGGKTNGVENPNTVQILADNGKERMYEAYAKIVAGDGLIYYTTAGHVIMAATDAHVEYVDGKIDPAHSFITIIDQGQTWEEDNNEQGDFLLYKGGVDVKKTFLDLFLGNYMPFTFGEFLGSDKIEITEAGFVLSDDTVCAKGTISETDRSFQNTAQAPASISVEQLFGSVVTANYGISDIYAIVYDSHGNEVYKHAVRATTASTYKMTMIEKAKESAKVNTVEKWGTLAFEEGETYTVKIVTQLSTGERPTLYTGTLTK